MIKQKKVVIFNAPPGSGKDVVCEHMVSMNPDVYFHNEFKSKLIELTQAVHGITPNEWDMIYTRESKEVPSDIFDGMSPRQALIKVSEEVIKPNYGRDYFGRAAAKGLKEGINVFSDGGFIEEIFPLSVEVGKENLHIIRIHRPGHTFESFGDSRRYISHEQVMDIAGSVHDVHNDGTLEKLFDTVCYIMERYVL